MVLRIGTCGFHYDDWRDVLYPPGLPPRRFLETYATRFDTVELDFTWYRTPSARTLESMVRRTPPGFRFALKLHRAMTHERTAGEAEYAAFREALAPMIAEGRLLALLAQLPQSFRPDRAARTHLEAIRERFAGLPLVFEFRHGEWIDDPVRRWMRHLGVGFCCVDEPVRPGLVPGVVWRTSHLAYVRFHGRNAHAWHDHRTAAERYDYRYTAAELSEWTDRIRALDAKAEETAVFFNNHPRGNAVRDAETLKGILEAG
jgi:uncharacterized protein YecE (DUF72 family)